MKRWHWLFLAFIVLFGSCTYGFLNALRSETYEGRVVDEESGAPLAGAVVTAIWYRTPAIQMEGSLYFLNAQETVTDADGRFSLQVSPGLDWDPTTVRVKEPAIVVYNPGYEPLWLATMANRGFSTVREFITALENGARLKLRKLKTKEELATYSSRTSVGVGEMPLERIPNLMGAINIQSQMAGLVPYPDFPEKGKHP